ncbi:polyketide cyclase [Enemella dayhoffiae]|uniref:Polyketide cyclase n=1 Tax=Enemella dayhoffiae TaxID=2016507 RepID=A0A255HCH3_9ACTN|nr:hypothetical protein [Enemella dayhoffiae]OYO25132.1 polyketide cyclase [Enemella dayhoffiae]
MKLRGFPSTHRAIDGTGWVLDPLDPNPLTEQGQRFVMNMYAEQGPTGGAYRMTNTVIELDRPRAIAWQPEVYADDKPEGMDDALRGWFWRYDLASAANGEGTEVTLGYDWSRVPEHAAKIIGFPPLPDGHLENSLANLARLAERS